MPELPDPSRTASAQAALPAVSARVDPDVWRRQPGYVALIVVADDVANGPSDAESDALLAEAAAGELGELLRAWSPGCRVSELRLI